MASNTPRRGLTSPVVQVEVTQEIIDESCQRDSSHCMVAEAVKAAVPNARFVSVDLATIRFTDLAAGVRYVYLTPRKAQIEILNFDQGEKSEPFSFQIRSAHVMPTGSANRARVSLQPNERSSTDRTPPTRVGGDAPPLGPLVGGAPENRRDKKAKVPGAGAANRTGKRREFGLRAIIR